MRSLKAFLLSQRTSFVALVVVLAVLILAPYLSGDVGMQGRSAQEERQESAPSPKEVRRAVGEDTEPVKEPEKRDRWDYYLSFAIALMTGIGVFLLIYYAFSAKHSKGPEEQRSALYLIVVALIIEAVLISGVMGVNVEQYESIYAAIAGYVLGTMG
ncbi:MAG: hypothetical protein ACE5JI_18710, partial [Acidobacteriota bacterium]